MPRRHPTLPTLALLLAAALPAGLAHAATASANATIEQFTLQLIDLDPNDGITPSISFGDVTYRSESGYTLDAGADILFKDAINVLGSTAVSGPAGSASTGSTATSWYSTASLDGDATGSPNAYGTTTYRASYTLSAATKAVFSISGSAGALHPDGPTYARANVFMGSQLSVWAPDWPHPTAFSVYRDIDGPTETFSFGGEVASLPGEVAYGSLEVSTTAFATLYGPPPPVPEPSTCAMLLAGAAIVGAARRRRQAR